MLLVVGSIGDWLACVAMLFAWSQAPRHPDAPGRGQWLLLALLFGALAIEKALQLDALVHDAMRAIATRNDVYGSRRGAQVAVVLVAVAALAWMMRRTLIRSDVPSELRWIRLFGFLLLGLDAIRAISLHQIDQILFASAGRLHLNHVLEGGLAALILYNTACCLRAWRATSRRSPGKPSGRSSSGHRVHITKHHEYSDQQIKRRNKS